MEKQTIEELVNLLCGVSNSQWARIKQQVDMMFSHAAAKVELGDIAQLKQNLEVEFNLRRFGETCDELDQMEKNRESRIGGITLEEKFAVDFGGVTLSSLVLTNDKAHFEKMKARGNIGVLFEPSVVTKEICPIYLIGIQKDTEDPIPSPKPD